MADPLWGGMLGQAAQDTGNNIALESSNQMLQDSIFGQVGQDALVESTQDALFKNSLDGMLTQQVAPELASNVGYQAAQQPGAFDQIGNFLGSKGFENTSKLGLGAFNAYNADQGRKDSKKFQNQNMKMARGTYDRNREYDDRLANLRF